MAYFYDRKRPATESPMAQKLGELGIKDPGYSAARESLFTFLCAAYITEEEKQRRIAIVLELQETYIDKTVCRVREPNCLGQAKWLTRNNRNLMLPRSAPEASMFQLYIAWKNGQKGLTPINLIRLVS